MKKQDCRWRCEKRTLPKCEGICKTFSDIQARYADALVEREDVESFRTNVPMDGLEYGDYTSDIVAVKTDGSLMVRECVPRRTLLRTKTCSLLDVSREYWMTRGVMDWGIVVEKKEDDNGEI